MRLYYMGLSLKREFFEREGRRVRLILSGTTAFGGRDGALRRPRRVQRRNAEACSEVRTHSFRPLTAGGDSAARRPHL
jgi:hypothetical protein